MSIHIKVLPWLPSALFLCDVNYNVISFIFTGVHQPRRRHQFPVCTGTGAGEGDGQTTRGDARQEDGRVKRKKCMCTETMGCISSDRVRRGGGILWSYCAVVIDVPGILWKSFSCESQSQPQSSYLYVYIHSLSIYTSIVAVELLKAKGVSLMPAHPCFFSPRDVPPIICPGK